MSSTSAQLLQICAVASQSSRHPSTYLPGLRCGGISTWSTIDGGPDFSTRAALKFPLHRPEVAPGASLLSSQGGGKQGSGVLSQVVQSRPATGSGQGWQNGFFPVTLAHFGPRQRAGIGFIAQVEPSGRVPLLRNVPLIGSLVPLFHWMAWPLVVLNGSGVRKKHASSSGSPAGQRRY